jgi:hypothetical protein
MSIEACSGARTGSLAITANTSALPSGQRPDDTSHDTSWSHTTSSERLGDSRPTLGVKSTDGRNGTSAHDGLSSTRLSRHTVSWADDSPDTEDMNEPIRPTDTVPVGNLTNSRVLTHTSSRTARVKRTGSHHGEEPSIGQNALRNEHTSSSLSKGIDSVLKQDKRQSGRPLARANEQRSVIGVETKSNRNALRNNHTCASLSKGLDSVLNQDKCQRGSRQEATRTLNET